MNFNFETLTGEDCYNCYSQDYLNKDKNFVFSYYGYAALFKYEPISIFIRDSDNKSELVMKYIYKNNKIKNRCLSKDDDITIKILRYKNEKYLAFIYNDANYLVNIIKCTTIDDNDLNKILLQYTI